MQGGGNTGWCPLKSILGQPPVPTQLYVSKNPVFLFVFANSAHEYGWTDS